MLPAVSLGKIDLKHISVTATPELSVAVLRNDGQLTWPATFDGDQFLEARGHADDLAQKAVGFVKTRGRVPADVTQSLNTEIDRMQGRLRAIGPTLTFADYGTAKSFLIHLESAVRALQKADVANYFNGKYALTAKTVPELVRQMTERGLTFAPALGGDEAAYKALHQALAAYGSALIAQTGGF